MPLKSAFEWALGATRESMLIKNMATVSFHSLEGFNYAAIKCYLKA